MQLFRPGLFRPLLFSLVIALTACTTSSAPPDESADAPQPSETASAVPTSETAEPKQTTTPPESAVIPTDRLSPSPIRISVSDLPEPYSSQSASKSPNVVPVPQNPTLNVPEGFTVNVFADGLDRPRWLALTPSGDVLVTETRQNRIRLLKDTNGDGVADVKDQFAGPENGLDIPFGMAFTDNFFFLGNTSAVLRFPYSQGQDQLTGRGEPIADLPGGGYRQHWTRNVLVSPDGQQLYVSIGSRSNVDREPLPRASVQRMNLDGSNMETFAYGLRNPVGLDFHPSTGELYTTVNERDGLGDDLVPDYLTRIRYGEFYGWPYAYLKPNLLDPRQARGDRSLNPDLAAETQTPDVLFQSHSAALGLKFYTQDTFPEKYHNGAFVAFRGSWNRSRGTGYKIVFVPFTDGRPDGYYEDFVTGFLTDPLGPTTWGRPVGVLVMPDGSLLFTEEMNNRIYRVQYQG
ncbi:MAG TPA: PQQ-dependent sugar dehydrogenase [Elainellaceae cyanobacterium]